MNQPQFQRLLASSQISLHYDIAELREDVKNLEAVAAVSTAKLILS